MKPVVTALLILTAGAASGQDYAPKAVDYIPRPVPPLPTKPAAAGECVCGSKPCGDANCQAHGRGGNCECKRAVTAASTDAEKERYAAIYAEVKAGSKATVAVGVPLPKPVPYTAVAVFPAGFRGLEDGVYDCYLDGDTPVMKLRQPFPRAMPAAPQPQFLSLPSWLPNRPGGSTCPGGNCPR